MRTKKSLYNLIASILLHLCLTASSFIITRNIILKFGSDVNGLTNSISQFLGYIALVEGGFGAVLRASLYKPLAENNIVELSAIIKTGKAFFRKIAYIFILFLLILTVLYPMIITDFDWLFTSSLILILGVNTFAEYYFGITYYTLLQSDQKTYIYTYIKIITILLNIIVVLILLQMNVGIHVIKICSTLIFVMRPILLNIYVGRKYKLIKNCKANPNALKQKWDGLIQHIAYFIHNKTDIVIITLFLPIREVSVYAVYYMIIGTLTTLLKEISSSIHAAYGNMLAKKENRLLIDIFKLNELISNILIVGLFTTAAFLIIPFISLYTANITDTNYIRFNFALIMILSEAVYAYRLPYQTIIMAGGKFKETRNGAIIEALINIVLSLILVNFIGLMGIIIGTLIAMLYRTINYIIFSNNFILHLKIIYFLKRIFVNILILGMLILIYYFVPKYNMTDFFQWIINALIYTSAIFIVVIGINFIFYRKEFLLMNNRIKQLFKKG